MVEPEELEALDPEKTRTIDIEDFVDLEQIDPIYFDHPYYLAPGTGGAKAYKLLLQAMDEAARWRSARVVIRSKESSWRSARRTAVLAMATMIFADEIVDPDLARRARPWRTSRRPSRS